MKKTHFLWVALLCISLASCKKSAGEASAFADDEYAAVDSVAVDTSVYAEDENIATIASSAATRTNQPKDRKFKKTAEVEFKVKNVLQVTEGLEDMIFAKGGYVVSSNLENNQQDYEDLTLSRDSIMVVRRIEVINHMTFKVPSKHLDSILRELKPFILFLDKRTITLDDVTAEQESNAVESDRLETYTSRQERNIERRGQKLNDISDTEDKLLERQLQADNARIRNKELNYNIRYSTLNIRIYQSPITFKETLENPNYIEQKNRPNLFIRIGNAFIGGWYVLETIIVFLFEIWALILFIIIGFISYRIISKKKKEKKTE